MEKWNDLKTIYLRLKKVKNIEYFIFILAIAIVISVFGNLFQTKEEGGELEAVSDAAVTSLQEPKEDSSSDQEFRLKNVLSAIQGAGSVEVMITYKGGKEVIPAMNTIESNTETEEHDSNGGIRRVNQTDTNTQPVSMTTPDGSQPLITKEIEPEVQGVIVVAEGAGDIRVRMELQQAVQTLLGIQSNQVEVFIMKENKTEE
jgi:stage III sporulation protein AG